MGMQIPCTGVHLCLWGNLDTVCFTSKTKGSSIKEYYSHGTLSLFLFFLMGVANESIPHGVKYLDVIG